MYICNTIKGLSVLSGRILLLASLTLLGACEENRIIRESSAPEVQTAPDGSTGQDPALSDTDGDGLTDAREAELSTSPQDPDTDGDGLTDKEEVVDLAFDATNDNFAFNPLIADLPRVSIVLTSLPDITISYGSSVSNATTDSVNYTEGLTESQTRTSSYSNSTTVEKTHEGGLSLNPKSLGLNYSYSQTTSEEESFSWEESQTVSNHRAYEQGLANTSVEGIDYTSGTLSVTIRITNKGNQSVEIPFKNLSLSAIQTDPADASRFKSIANLTFESGNREAPTITLQPGESTDDALRFSREIDLGTALGLLKDSSNLIVRLATWNFIDGQGRSFGHDATYYNAKNAMIVIDYGPNSERGLVSHLVATGNPDGSTGISATDALGRIMAVPYQTGSIAWDYDGDGSTEGTTAQGITAIREARADSGSTAYWMVLHQYNDPVSDRVARDLYDPLQSQPVLLEDLLLKAGSVLHFVYIEDRDHDGVAAREEFLHGTLDDPDNPHSADTDQDGRTDFEELRESWTVNIRSERNPARRAYSVHSSPSHDDLDRDGLSDAEEQRLGLDPANSDTDEDGIPDGSDRRHISLAPIIEDLNIQIRNISVDAGTGSQQTDVNVYGSVTATAPNVIARLEIDWGDGSLPLVQTQQSGGNSTATVDVTHTYATSGSYTITLDIVDDDRPTHRVLRMARIQTHDEMRIVNALGYTQGYRVREDVREVVDINSDGYADIVAVDDVGVVVALGSLTGFGNDGSIGPLGAGTTLEQWLTWGPDDDYRRWNAGGGADEPRWIADVNGDGLMDFIGVRFERDEVRVALQQPGGGFAPTRLWIDLATQPWSGWAHGNDAAQLADVDGNGLLDLVVAKRGLAPELHVYRTINTDLETANVVRTMPAGFGPPANNDIPVDQSKLKVADLDNDGCADVLYGGEDHTHVLRSQCDGSFGRLAVVAPEADAVVLSDVDEDGDLDLVSFFASEVSVSRNVSSNGHIEFNAAEHWSDQWVRNNGGWSPRYLADLDGDGDSDIIAFGSTSVCGGINRVTDLGIFTDRDTIDCYAAYDLSDRAWFEDGGFGGLVYFPRTVADLNGDGRADFIGFSRDDVVYSFAPTVEQFQ